MAKPKKALKTPEDEIQDIIGSIIVDNEYKVAASLQSTENIDFESMVDILESQRNEKDYEWMSDIRIPEMLSIHLTDASAWANLMFQSRDFVEVKLDGETEEDKLTAKAVKKCINKTLNDRDIFYYPKYMRLRTINSLIGKCWILAWWDRETTSSKRAILKTVKTGMDIYGQPFVDPKSQIEDIRKEYDHEDYEKVTVDRFNFDVLDPRNVFTDNKYCYSAQQKDWIIVRSETSYEEQKAKEKASNYFNLDKVKEAVKAGMQSDTAKETYAKDANGEINKTPITRFDVIDRYGKFWAMVTKRDVFQNPIEAKPGVDRDGLPLDGAELIETIITYDLIAGQKIMVRFIPTPFIDSQRKPYKPLARGLCYIHPIKDEGLSDGKSMRGLQNAMDDTFNISQDRVMLATLPTFIGKKATLDDNLSEVYFEPEHVIPVENMDDLKEITIRDNVVGALNQINMLKGSMYQVSSIYPPQMGAMPEDSSTTATAIAGAQTSSNVRGNYKNLTWEHMFATEFYWLILQMTYRFATEETILKLMGEDAAYFNANADFTYSPVSSSIETEYNKYKKVQQYDQTLGRLSGMVPVLPKLVPILAHIVGRQLELLGDEFQDVSQMIADLSKSKPEQDGAPVGSAQPQDMGGAIPASNQNGAAMQPQEMGAREAAMPMGGVI